MSATCETHSCFLEQDGSCFLCTAEKPPGGAAEPPVADTETWMCSDGHAPAPVWKGETCKLEHPIVPPEPTDADASPEPTHLERLRALLLDDAGLDAIPDPVPLIRGLIYRDTLVWLQGRPGHGKSFVALDWAASVCTGETWQGFPVSRGPVLYLIAEGGSGFKARVRAWKKATGSSDTGIRFLPVAVQSSNATAWAALCRLAAELGPALVVIDTQARVTVGMEENTSRDMSTFVDRCEDLRIASGGTVLVIHHQGRTGEHLRGHSSMEGAATTIVRAEKDGETVKLTCVKQKDEPEFEDIALRLIPTDSSAVLALTDTVDSPQATSPAVRKMLSEWWRIHESDLVSVAVLVKSGVVVEATFHRAKKALIRAGLVATDGKGRAVRYRLEKNPDE